MLTPTVISWSVTGVLTSVLPAEATCRRTRHYASLVWYFQFSLGDPRVNASHGAGSGAHASDEPIVGELRPCPECHEVGLRPLLAEPVLRL